ncbi:NAD(P)/FAD-dependent oxidoreductase [Bradyrhizobium tropiciagri]|uniref:NAD(P)/FAD-dependent oxidoreductase n=1 Tax=Bradyrhizobium tropiciagri TaxID=312253 RepID=UPI001BA9FDFB|nr:NAD(P)/FAD-dependent oxidoreductase [Bradyrhizobium tropiciagri]MBR0875319.1 NAD(P)/FAD-dependent oxidoreductase [Bradyrhizobium tropiciagri]
MVVDVIVVGGGPAGLSAALILGRSRRNVLLCDDRQQRNSASPEIHGLLGSNARSPAQFLQNAREEVAGHETVLLRRTRVTKIDPSDGAFKFACADGTTGIAAKVLLATGLIDELPELAGIEALYGISVHHCLYCDGYEYTGKRVVAYGKGDKGADLAVMIKHWVKDVVCCSDGTEVSEQAVTRLRQHEITLRKERIQSLEGPGGALARIHFESGSGLACSGLFFSTGCRQASDLSTHLGCKRDEKGGIITDPATEETSVPGVYVAGDASRDVLLVAVAVGEGAKGAVAINKAFLRRDGLCD